MFMTRIITWDVDLTKVTMTMWRRVVRWIDTDVPKESSPLPFNVTALNMEATHSSETLEVIFLPKKKLTYEHMVQNMTNMPNLHLV